ncbi:MAG: hypothetical protein ILA52_01240 [Alphaproteobacteria bacterium]|nr:hypothetical protein [Alphaproteobacteria bacterium]
MVKINLKRIMFLMLGLLLISLVLKCSVFHSYWDIAADKIMAKRMQYNVSVTADELEEFAKLWPQYKEFTETQNNFISSYSPELPSRAISWRERVWFRYHSCDIDRFFYVQQRIDYLLHALDIRRDAQAILDELPNSNDEVTMQMIDLQKRRIAAADMSFSELILVTANEEKLRELLQIYP